MGSDSQTRRTRRRLLSWGAFVAIGIIIIPMTAYILGGSPLERPASLPTDSVAATSTVEFGAPYDIASSLTVPVGVSGVPVLEDSPGPAGPLALTATCPAPGGGAWLLDFVGGAQLTSRVRRVDAAGRTLALFDVPGGLALAESGIGDDVWLGFAALDSDGHEVVRHYSGMGQLLGTYELPKGAFARSLTVTRSNELYAQLEEYANDLEEKSSVYRSGLIRIATGPDLAQEADPAATLLDGSFFGQDGLRYVIDSEAIPFAGEFAFPAATVTAYDGGASVRAIRTPRGWRPFAADASGRVYCEQLPVHPSSETVAYESLGEWAVASAEVRIFDENGLYARVPVQPPRLLNEFSPVARVYGDQIHTVRVDDDGVHVLRLEAVTPTPVMTPVPAITAAELLVVAGPLEPLAGDPYRARDNAERDVFRMVHAGLVRPVPGAGVSSDLAVEVPDVANGGVSPDGLTITYVMRDDRFWHDGTPVTAADVVATWEYLCSASTVPRTLFPGAGYIASVEAEGRKVHVRLSEPYGPAPREFFPFVLQAASLRTPGAALNGRVWAEPVGAGPYRLVRWTADAIWQLEAASANAPIGRIDVVFSAGDDARDTFQSSRTPAVWLRVPDDMTLDLSRDQVGEIHTVDTGSWKGLVINSAGPVVNDRAVRRALLLALPNSDWSELIPSRSAWTVRPFGAMEGAPAVSAGMEDSRAAAAALDAAGWRDDDGDGIREKNGAKLEVRYALTIRDGQDEVSYEEVELLEKAWTALGVKVTRQFGAVSFYAPWYANGYLATGIHQVGIGTFSAPSDPGVASLFDPTDVPGPGDNCGVAVTRTNDLALAELHAEARAEYDPQRRADIAGAVARRAVELGLVGFLRPDLRSVAVVGSIDGFAPGAYPSGTLWNIGEWELSR